MEQYKTGMFGQTHGAHDSTRLKPMDKTIKSNVN